jgi:hypothetical protein
MDSNTQSSMLTDIAIILLLNVFDIEIYYIF